MKMKNIFITVSAGLILFLLAGCSALKPTPPQTAPTQTPEIAPASGVQYYFVTNKLLIPTTQEQTTAFALDVDGDAQHTPDNKFGDLFTLLSSAGQGIELQSTLDQAINSGQLISLHVVQANDLLNDPSVSWSIFQGQEAQSAPNFDGADNFTLDSDALVNLPITGSLANGRFTGGSGTTRVQIFLLGQSVEMDLIGVRLEADLSAAGCANGKLGGGVTVDEFRSKLLPAIAGGLNQMITTDSSAANTLLQAFDSDNDGAISIQELENNPLIKIVSAPDLDLLDASGTFNPNQDGIKDSYSAGFGFSCVPAIFIAP